MNREQTASKMEARERLEGMPQGKSLDLEMLTKCGSNTRMQLAGSIAGSGEWKEGMKPGPKLSVCDKQNRL